MPTAADSCRRRILTQLNRTEGRHTRARDIFHGNRGQLRQLYREGQEDQFGALGHVVNAIVLWNTRNFPGRYRFRMPELPPNQPRPLRDPNSQG